VIMFNKATRGEALCLTIDDLKAMAPLFGAVKNRLDQITKEARSE